MRDRDRRRGDRAARSRRARGERSDHRSRADSRDVGPGDLFVALNAGTRFVDDARAQRQRDARASTTRRPRWRRLASLVRSAAPRTVVAVVGSAGKTTTKDILGALCAPHVPTIWADKSLNNEIGLPLTVCRLEPETRVLVTEMGMRGLGQIAALCEIARPDVVVDPAHRPRAPRVARHRRTRGGGERRGDRRAACRRHRRRARARRTARAVPHARRRLVPALRSGRDRRARTALRASRSTARPSSSSSRSRSATSRSTRSPRCTRTTRSASRSTARTRASPASGSRRGAERSSRFRAAASS